MEKSALAFVNRQKPSRHGPGLLQIVDDIQSFLFRFVGNFFRTNHFVAVNGNPISKTRLIMWVVLAILVVGSGAIFFVTRKFRISCAVTIRILGL